MLPFMPKLMRREATDLGRLSQLGLQGPITRGAAQCTVSLLGRLGINAGPLQD